MSNTILDLSKKFELNLAKAGFTTIPSMRTRLAVDKSGSMGSLFRAGFVEKTIELFLGAAAKFDDNGELEYTFFNTRTDDMKTIGVNSYKSMKIPTPTDGTNYLPALEELVDITGESTATPPKPAGIFGKIFGGKAEHVVPSVKTKEPPVYIGFITDGEPNDLDETVKYLNNIANSGNFVQFIVLGSDVSKRTMASLTANKNVASAIIQDPASMSVDELYDIIANPKLLEWSKNV